MSAADEAYALIQHEMWIENMVLSCMDDGEFLEEVLTNGNKKKMNELVSDNKFPAYDIAQRIKDNGWAPSEKQRQAIMNVYIYTQWN